MAALEAGLPELRLGTLDLLISDEYDGHPRPRPSGVRFALLHEERLQLVLPATHPRAGDGAPVEISALRDDVWAASQPGTGHHALLVSTCRTLGGYEPDLRHRSNDADVQLELVRRTGAVGLLPAVTLPTADPALAIRDVAVAAVGRRLFVAVRDRPAGPALRAFLTALSEEADRLTPVVGGGREARTDPGTARPPAPSPPAPAETAPSVPG
jgi:DNA-binding transcriptional LysR family regulator